MSWRWCVPWLVLVLGCGGNVEGGANDPEAEGNSGEAPSPPAGDDVSASDDADSELGACKLGRKEDWREPCAWVADGRCYSDREMACNCACPRSRNSQCVSGFEDGPHGHVWVSCN